MADSDDTGDSPWAGDVPVPAAPVEFTWATAEPEALPAPLHASAHPGSHPGSHPGRDPASGPVPDAGPDRRRWAVGAIAAVALLGLGWLVAGRGGGDDSAPSATTEAPEISDDSLPASDAEPTTTAPAAQPQRTTLPGNDAVADVDSAAVWRKDVIVLPPVLQAMTEPFDIVAVTADGDFVEIAVPSGNVTARELGKPIDAQVTAGATTSLLTWYFSAPEGQLWRVGEEPIDLALPDNVDSLQARQGTDRYVGVAYGNGVTPDRVEIGSDGSITVTEVGGDQRSVWQQSFLADGSQLVTEAGGVYREVDGAFERVSSGVLLAVSSDRLLVRECDEAMQCGSFTVVPSTGERTAVQLGEIEGSPYGFGEPELSPDGKWLRLMVYSDTSVDEVLVDLATGARTEQSSTGGVGHSAHVWAADSSGFLRQSPSEGFEFFDVATQQSVGFGAAFGRILSFDIRIDAAAPAVPAPIPTTTGVGLIGVTGDGDIVELDVDSGATVTTDGLGISSEAPLTIFVDAAGAVITSYDNVESVRFHRSTRSVLAMASVEPSGPLIEGPSADTAWQIVAGNADGDLAFELVDALGNPAGASITAAAADVNGVLGSDGAGGVIVTPAVGGVFVLSGGGDVEAVTSGELLGINAQTAYVHECDATLRCGLFVVDRATGRREPVELTLELDRVGVVGGRGVPTGHNVSPDGQVLFSREVGRSGAAMMIDVAADRWTGVPLTDLASPVVWTADSNYAIWLSDGQVTVFERSTRSVRTINTVELRAIAAVPTNVS